MKNLLVSTVLIIIFALSAVAQNDSCTNSAWVTDRDPKGTNVRAKPGLNGKVISVLPFAKAFDDDKKIVVEIIGYSNGWLKITSAESIDTEFTWKGDGWISAKKVTFEIESDSGSRSVALYAADNRKSKKIATVPDTARFDIVGFSCFGFKISYKGKTGWIRKEDTCGSPVTTCA